MAKLSRPRWSSLQYWPRKRVDKFLPSVNWSTISSQGLLGFIAYKAAMGTAIVKDSTDKSMTSGKKVFIPVTILEVPNMKIFSVRFYNQGVPIKDVIVSNDKELKHILKVPKTLQALDSQIPKEFDDIRVLVYSLVKQTTVKKTPDLTELAVNAPNKLEYVKSLLGKEITIKDFAEKINLVDSRGLTKGKGLVSAIKRHGLGLKGHKSEKGVRRPGSLGPWHPARVTFKTPMSGQLGMFNRIQYNNKIVSYSSIQEKNINPGTGFKHYGNIKTNYIIIKGSIQGPVKRQILLTPAFRPTKILNKMKYEFQELA